MHSEAQVISGDPGWIISINVKLDKGGDRTMVFQTHVPQELERPEINKLVDKAFSVGDRQVDAYRLVELENELAINRKTLGYCKEDLARIEANAAVAWERQGKRGEVKLSGAEAANKTNAIANVKRYEDEIAWQEARIGQLRERIKQDAY